MQLARGRPVPRTSSSVRRTFIDFFCNEKGHKHVRSSPLLPLGDPSLAFTNAGMNQFKSILQGVASPPSSMVANSQKCVRVGGKHNDLSLVGRDGTHHTFFEMLGNWSFGSYFKTESCALSWELLTQVYGLDPLRLHVTYFGGDPSLGLEPDLETYDVWRSMGLPDERIKPGLARDNFWEMGNTGPCGGCTEIHYDRGGTQDLLELWNLVFVEYNRESSGKLTKLGRRHVDTGMGFERLVAVLEDKSSNYDTDLFLPLFTAIEKSTRSPPYSGRYGSEDGSGLDTAYRVLADHSRMVTHCLADGFLPDQEGKLRGILRKTLTVSRDFFQKEEVLLKELALVIAEMFEDVYPEVGMNLNRINHIIDHEAELLRVLRSEKLSDWKTLSSNNSALSVLCVDECPNLVPAYQRLRSTLGESTNGQPLSPEIALKTCETFGVPHHLTGQLAAALGMTIDLDMLEELVMKAKCESRREIYEQDVKPGLLPPQVMDELTKEGVKRTKDLFKYDYLFGFDDVTSFPDQQAEVVALVVDGTLIDQVPSDVFACGIRVGVILDRTNMYSEAGGQCCDTGVLKLASGTEFVVEQVSVSGGYVVHWVRGQANCTESINLDDAVTLSINSERRLDAMRNHTATHLLNGALKQILSISDQKSSRVTPTKLSFDFSVYRESLNLSDLKRIEDGINLVIKHDVPVKKWSVPSTNLNKLRPLTTLPGETYLHNTISLIEISSGYFLSREPCCGTHVPRTGMVQDFVITNYKSLSSGVKSIQAVTGQRAEQCRRNAELCVMRFHELSQMVDSVLANKDKSEVENCSSKLNDFVKVLSETTLLGHIFRVELTDEIEILKTKLKYNARDSLRLSMDAEMKEALANNMKPYFVHYLQCSSTLDSVPLQKATKLCSNKPCIVFARTDGLLKARCSVPKVLVTETFSAERWLGVICKELNAEGGPPKGQNPSLVYNMKGKKVSDVQLESALEAARLIVEKELS